MMKPDEPLNLKAWKVEVTPPDDFQAEVWQRIAARASERHESTGFVEWLDAISARMFRPAWAVAIFTISIGSGLGLGQLAANQTRTGALQELQSRYVQSINPLASAIVSLK